MDIQQLIAECRMREEKAKGQANKSDFFYHMKCRNTILELSEQVNQLKKDAQEADEICRAMSNIRMQLCFNTQEEVEAFLSENAQRIRQLIDADRAGRIKVLPEATGQVCGTCANFKRKPGRKSGTCKVRKYYTDRRGNEDHMRGEFTPSQSRQACRQYKSAEPEGLAAVLKDRFFCMRNYCCTKECSKCCDYGECFSCALCGFPYECQKCERNYTKEQLEKIRNGEDVVSGKKNDYNV